MAKKNNPGCDCCGKVLIWDMGIPSIDFQDRRRYQFSYTDVPSRLGFPPRPYATYLKAAFDEIGVTVERAVPEALVTGRNGDFYDIFPQYDPYSSNNNGYEGFWTRNVYDYRLIIWVYPLENFSTQQTEPCATGIDGLSLDNELWDHPTADHEYWGGEPNWFDDVVNGTWQGRLFVTTGLNSGTAGPGAFATHHVNRFINNHLTSRTGMSIDLEEALARQYTNKGMVPVPSDLTEGVLFMEDGGFVGVENGDETLFRPQGEDYSTPWCGSDRTPKTVSSICSRSRRVVDVDGVDIPKDFVIAASSVEYTDTATDPYSPARFWQNLYEVPIADPDA